MKRVYLVRHGVTEALRGDIYQYLDTPLAAEGRQQAERLAERFSRIEFDVLMASTMKRAQETAEIIGSKTGHKVIEEHLFHELLRPTIVRGRERTEPEVKKIVDRTVELWASENERHSDEENFYDLKNRARGGLDVVLARPEKTIVVVTHGTMLNMLMAVMIGGAETTPELFAHVDKFMYSTNTGITTCDYGASRRQDGWSLVTWNDHAHLG